MCHLRTDTVVSCTVESDYNTRVTTSINKQRNSGGSLYFIYSVVGGLYEVIHVVMYVKVS